MKLYALLFSACFLPSLSAQDSRETIQAHYQIQLQQAETEIKVDGDLSDLAWTKAAMASNFWLQAPTDGTRSPARTEVRILRDQHALYVGVTCFDSLGTAIVQSLKRDAQFWASDAFVLLLDPANQASNAYLFGVNAAGVQTDGLLSAVQFGDDFTWDNRWSAEVRRYSDRWTAEMAIPLSTLRFSAQRTDWGINFIRRDASAGHTDTWTNVPLQYPCTDLGCTGKLLFDTPPSAVKGRFNLIPYVGGIVSKDLEAGNEKPIFSPQAGIDAKLGIGPALNLDLTLNPDFSQVETDEQVINLTRFDVLLPEKRTFFLENADIFDNFSNRFVSPFVSRRIGLDAEGNRVPISFGARLSGNLNAGTRIGLMTMQTRSSPDGTPGQNYSALAFNQRIFGRTSINAYYLNRQAFDKNEALRGDYGRNAGAELAFTSEDGAWAAWANWHQSFQPGPSSKSGWGSTGLSFSSKNFNIVANALTMGKNYHSDMGFENRIENYDAALDSVIRLGYHTFYTEGDVDFFSKNENSLLNYTALNFASNVVLNTDGSANEQTHALGIELNFRNTSKLRFDLEKTWAEVPVSFKFEEGDPENCPALPAGKYQYAAPILQWESDSRRRLGITLEATAGNFYNGQKQGAAIELRYRAQPWGVFRLKTEYNHLDFPAPYCDAVLFAITPRVEIFFNRNLNWTTFVQYNTQADNFNINCRLQWRFRPMSDLFLVYTENNAVKQWGLKNRAVSLKVNYWF